MRTPWLMTGGRRLSAPSRLFCFPFAGGGATFYRQWPGKFGDETDVIPVQLPGRENRIREPLISDLEELTPRLGEAMEPYLGERFSFFGYSMGALIAYELAHWLEENRGLGPEWLFVAGRRAPHLSPPSEPFHDWPEAKFWERVRRLEGTPVELFEHPELLELLGPVLRGDLKLCDTYHLPAPRPVSCPICAFAGEDDEEAPPEAVEPWRAATRASFESFILPGGHFFINQRESDVIGPMRERLSRVNRIA